MSASTQAAPRQISFGRLPSALAMLALVVIIAAAVAIVALNGTKAAAPATSGAKGQPPPAVIDHGWSSGETIILPKAVPHLGGWGGPRLAPEISQTLKGPVYLGSAPALKGPVYLGDNSREDRNLISRTPFTTGAPRGLERHAQ
jgi:hypothetical protein